MFHQIAGDGFAAIADGLGSGFTDEVREAGDAAISAVVQGDLLVTARIGEGVDIDKNLSDHIEHGVDAELPVPGTTVPMISRSIPMALDLDQRLRALAQDRGVDAADLTRQFLEERVEYETRVQALREAIIEGENSGPTEPFDFDEFIAQRRAEARLRDDPGPS